MWLLGLHANSGHAQSYTCGIFFINSLLHNYHIYNHFQFVFSLEFQHNSTMKIPTKLHLDFSHSITLYATTFSSFLHQSFNTIQPCKYPQKLHLDFSHSITLYAATFNSFLHQLLSLFNAPTEMQQQKKKTIHDQYLKPVERVPIFNITIFMCFIIRFSSISLKFKAIISIRKFQIIFQSSVEIHNCDLQNLSLRFMATIF